MSLRARVLGGLAAAGVLVGGGVATAGPVWADTAPTPVVVYSSFDSDPGPVSEPFAAETTREFGDGVTLATAGGTLDSVVVRLVSWACQEGGVYSGDCSTTPGATFDQALTVTLHAVAGDGTLGAVLAQRTQTFAIPYRPSGATTDQCAKGAEVWFDAASGLCRHGIAAPVTFTGFGAVTLPATVVVTVAFPTSSTDPSVGSAPADSLNVALVASGAAAPSVGTDAVPGDAWIDTRTGHYFDYTSPSTAGMLADSSGLRETLSAYDLQVSERSWYIPQIAVRVAADPAPTQSPSASAPASPAADPTPSALAGTGVLASTDGELAATDAELAATGARPLPLVLVAAGLIAAGLALVVARRRAIRR